jgi:hypothetical protein
MQIGVKNIKKIGPWNFFRGKVTGRMNGSESQYVVEGSRNISPLKKLLKGRVSRRKGKT